MLIYIWRKDIFIYWKKSFFQNKKQTKEWNKLWTCSRQRWAAKVLHSETLHVPWPVWLQRHRGWRLAPSGRDGTHLSAGSMKNYIWTCDDQKRWCSWSSIEIYTAVAKWPPCCVAMHHKLNSNLKESWQIKYGNISVGICWQILGVWRGVGSNGLFFRRPPWLC